MQRGALRRRRLRLCKRARCFFCNPGNLQEFWCVAKPGAPQARAIRTGEHVARRPTCTECRSEYPEGDSDTTRAHQDRRQVATVSVFWAFFLSPTYVAIAPPRTTQTRYPRFDDRRGHPTRARSHCPSPSRRWTGNADPVRRDDACAAARDECACRGVAIGGTIVSARSASRQSRRVEQGAGVGAEAALLFARRENVSTPRHSIS